MIGHLKIVLYSFEGPHVCDYRQNVRPFSFDMTEEGMNTTILYLICFFTNTPQIGAQMQRKEQKLKGWYG